MIPLDKHPFLVITVVTVILYCCNPIDDSIDPEDYELYISTSADRNSAISPDGSLIAYFHESMEYPMPDEYPTGLYLMNSDGTNKRLLISGIHFSPSWSPDGQWISYTSSGIIEIINLEGDSVRTSLGLFENPMYFPNWSPNGKSIIFSTSEGDAGIYISDPLFASGRKFIENPGNPGFDPCWAPDNSKILYSKYISGSEELFVIDTTSLQENSLTANKRINRGATWSPNGNFIAWSKSTNIVIMNSDGTHVKRLDYGQYPSWSPSSDYIIYSNANSDFTKEVLWRINVDGSKKTQLTF